MCDSSPGVDCDFVSTRAKSHNIHMRPEKRETLLQKRVSNFYREICLIRMCFFTFRVYPSGDGCGCSTEI